MMKKRNPKRKGRKKSKIILIIAGCILMALVLFFGLFYTTKIEVVGNTRYSSAEIKKMTITNVFKRNSVLLSVFSSEIRMDEGKHPVPFMESVQVEYINRNTIRLHVNEKTPVGYISDKGMDYYFDKDGVVLEAFKSSEKPKQQTPTPAPTDTPIPTPTVPVSGDQPDANGEQTPTPTPEQANSTDPNVTVTPVAIGTEGASPEDAAGGENGGQTPSVTPALPDQDKRADGTYGSSSDAIQFRPALTDVPLIMGLPYSKIEQGKPLDVEYKGVFNSIMALTKLIDRYEIVPDMVEVGENYTFILHYGGVRINLGKDTNLEKKMSRADAILPKLSGMSGVLHLEDYSDDTINIIFDKDV